MWRLIVVFGAIAAGYLAIEGFDLGIQTAIRVIEDVYH